HGILYFVEYLDEVQEVLDVMELVRVARSHRWQRIFRQRMDPFKVFTDDKFVRRSLYLTKMAVIGCTPLPGNR
ncbi:hypothetical protein Hamer_G000665, partial [Homarus americanus]